MSFCPPDSPDERGHRRQIALAANAALRGESHNAGRLAVPAGALKVSLKDPRLGVDKVISLTALDSVAAALRPWVENTGKGAAAIQFLEAPPRACVFQYLITGQERFNG